MPSITKISTTSECLTPRAGLAPFVNFLKKSHVSDELSLIYQDLRKSKKGIKLKEAFLQILLFLADGTEQSLESFDRLNQDESWIKIHGCKEYLNTASLKRLLYKADKIDVETIRPYFHRIFQSVLKNESPNEVVLFLDSCVYNNDGAKCRAGVKPTYKNFQGYHPINLIWNGFYVDTYFQSGHCSTNHGDIVKTMLKNASKSIRETLGPEVTIIVRMDGGFYDQKIFKLCDELGVNFVCAGKVYKDHTFDVHSFSGIYENKNSMWKYEAFQECRKSWDENMKYRALKLVVVEENGEPLLGLNGRIILSNYDNCSDEKLIEYDHSRGKDELTHREVKDFTSERMPCLDFHANQLWYYMGILAFNLFQVFKRKIACLFKTSYPTTFRRKFFDIAGKIIPESRSFTLKIHKFKMKELQFNKIWERSLIPWII
jgi:hypothetical protein